MSHLNTLLTGILISFPLMAGKLQAAEWERNAGLSVGTEFSDNICLGDDDQDVRGFTTVTPDIRLRGSGARANINLAGSLKYNTMGESDFTCSDGQKSVFSTRQTWVPNIRYQGDLELIDNWLTLESDGSARSTNIDSFSPGNTDNIDGRDNVNIVYNYGAGARIQRRVFNSADMLVRVNYNEQSNGVRALGDSSEERGEFDIGTERANNRLTVGISGRTSKVMYEGTELVPAFENTLSSAETRASLQLSQSWEINALVGEDWNQFISLTPDIDGSYWDASLHWAPNDRVDVDIGTGERFFGSTPRVNIRYSHKRSELSVSYNRSLTLPRDLRTTNGGFDTGFDPDEGSVFDEFPDSPLLIIGEPTFLGNSPVINERLSVSYRYVARRTTVSISGSNSKQLRLEDLNDATFSNLRLSLSRTLSSSLTANMNLSWSESEGRGSNVSVFSEPSQTWRAVFGLNRRLGRSTTLDMSYQYTDRKSDSSFNKYTENRIVLTARHQF